MRIFSVTQDVTLVTNVFRRQYLAMANPEAAQVDRLYLEVGQEARLVGEKLKEDYLSAHPELDDDAKGKVNPADLGLQLAGEHTLLPWSGFPTRLGRISSRFVEEEGLYFHQEALVLPAQLQALRAARPDKQHFRLAILNGFGTNLGDCTIGLTAYRVLAAVLAQHLPSVSCDFVFGVGAGAALAEMVGHEKLVERVLFETLTVCEFAHYDAYLDFTTLINGPKYDEMPTVDWVLWWCGLDPHSVPAVAKRNRGHIRWDAWNAVHRLLKDKPGKKILFNPKASVPLRTMPTEVALKFARRLLDQDPEIKLVIDQPLALKHKRLIDVSAQIDAPEKFKALCGLVDGIITVNSFASHAADFCATPAVHLCSTIPGSHYPYYPFSAALNPEGFEQLPAFNKVKVSDEEWAQYSAVYETAWASFSPAEVLRLLREKMALRQAASNEPPELQLVGDRKLASCVDVSTTVPRLTRLRLMPEHVRARERFEHLTQHVLKPGSVCVLACAPDPGLALTLERRVAPLGELIILEPRALLARSVEGSLFAAGAFAARVQQSVAMAEVNQVSIKALSPWSESRSSEWGNDHQAINVPNQTIDEKALAACTCLIVQSPMPFGPLIAGAIETLKRCRPFVFMSPVSRAEAGTVCKTAQAADYEFWAEAALPDADMSRMLLVGVPKEKSVKIDGFFKVEVD